LNLLGTRIRLKVVNIVWAGLSNTGKIKENNEDHYAIVPPQYPELPYIFAISDGVGGRKGGDLASVRAIQVISDYFVRHLPKSYNSPEVTQKAFEIANSDLRLTGSSNANLSGMGTTVVFAALFEDTLQVTWIGDSRAYILRKNILEQITTDHTLPNELFKRGSITQKQLKNHPCKHHLVRALGIDETVKPEMVQVPAQNLEWMVLCTDGLYEHVSDIEIQGAIHKLNDPTLVTKKLIQMALSRGGTDNVTVVVVKMAGTQAKEDKTSKNRFGIF